MTLGRAYIYEINGDKPFPPLLVYKLVKEQR